MAKDPKKTPNEDQVRMRLQELGVEIDEDDDYHDLRKKLSKAKKAMKDKEAEEAFGDDIEDEDDEDAEDAEDEKVTMEKEEFQNMMAEVKKLRDEVQSLKNGDVQEVEDKAKYRKAKVRFFDGEIVTGYGNTKQYYNDQTEEYGLKIEVLTGKCSHDEDKCEGGTECDDREVHIVDYTNFMDFSDWKWGKIKDKKKKKDREVQGKVERSYLKEGEWSMTNTGKMVDVEVIREKIIYLLELPDGTEVELSEEALN